MTAASSPAGATEWFRRARRYLRVARAILDDGFADVSAFNAEQAAEFALKALQLQLTGSFSRTHDLALLAGAVSAPPRIVKPASLLSQVYVAARYPDVGGPRISRLRAEAYLDSARRIVRWVRRQLP